MAWGTDLEIPFWLAMTIILTLVLMLVFHNPSQSSSRARSGRGSSKKKKGEEEEPRVSAAARDVATRLGVGGSVGGRASKRRVPVTVFVNDVVLRKERDGEWVAIESAIRVLALLNEVASVFLVSMVGSDLDESLVKDVALSSGLTCPSSTNASKASAAPAPTPTGIPEHRLLFCSSHIGQVAVVRQLAPSLHIGGAVALLEGVSRFVPSLLRIDASAVEPPPESAALPPAEAEKAVANGSGSSSSSARGAGGYSLEWREFKTLAAAAGLTLPVASEATTSAGGRGAQQPMSDGGQSGSSVRSGSSAAESRVDASAADGRDSTVAEGGGLGEDEAEELGAPPNASTLSKGDEKDVGQSYGALPSSPPYSPTLS